MKGGNQMFFSEIFNDIKINCEITGLTDELKAIYIYNLLKKSGKSIVFLTSTLYEANDIYQRISNYTDEVLLFPMDDFLTSEALAVSPELKTTRIETLRELTVNNKQIVVANLMGYLRYLPDKEIFIKKTINLNVGDTYEIKKLVTDLYDIGYIRETIVNKTGEIATRGYVVDVFPISNQNPIRIEFWGDSIESIRTFDINSQLTIEEVSKIDIYPCTEFLLDNNDEDIEKKQYNLSNYTTPVNINCYLEDCCIVFDDYSQIHVGYKMLLEEVLNYNISTNRASDFKYMNDLYEIKNNNFINFVKFDNYIDDSNLIIHYNSKEIQSLNNDKNKIIEVFNNSVNSRKTVVVCVSNRYKVNRLIEECCDTKIVYTTENEIFLGKINVIVKNITSGFEINNLIIITESEIFSKKNTSYQYKTNFRMGTKIKDISRLNIGDYIIHNVHGIGRYCGIKTLLKNGLKKDYLFLEYRDNDKLYIPVEKIDYISKYSSNDSIVPRVNKLGTTEWERTKLKVKKKIESIAGDLLKLYAQREASTGFSFEKDNEEQIEFEKEFIYKETIDQLRVSAEIKRDMEKSTPMDRLLCGDVGFGKTEVAFRAIFKAVLSNKQVALLCPTTILSQQHYSNALERFKSYPINIALLNRFVSKKEINQQIKKIKEGKIDIVIGTHRILSDDVKFKDLGLLVVDEEQRFGVKHKEKIKSYKNNVDVLTLTATPIPRTLQMSMAGIRNLSLIETPPVNRYPVQTYVLAENNQIIKDAVYKEISRDGQVFILYNRIEDISLKVQEISRLVPHAKVGYAHGQMSKQLLEEVMLKFINKDYNVLICTTIIETGIDIPSANTLIIFNADRFGLAQLYQIRGRVGRSNKIAYCYLMYEQGKVLSEVATKRLKVIKDYTELGSGFSIAARDLSIRGAGDILGSEQAGFIDTIGIELFLKMLNEEINRLKGKEIVDIVEQDSNQPLIDVETSIDDNYVEDEELKIEIHKKINMIDSYEKLLETKTELEDRFGNVSEELLIYMYEEWFEKLAKELNITNVRQTKNFVEIILDKNMTQKINGDFLFIEASRISRMFRFSLKNNRLIITLDIIKLDKHFIYYLVDLFEVIKKAKKS
jgi:transcription-repair coupling factor (superfamily II helicase)